MSECCANYDGDRSLWNLVNERIEDMSTSIKALYERVDGTSIQHHEEPPLDKDAIESSEHALEEDCSETEEQEAGSVTDNEKDIEDVTETEEETLTEDDGSVTERELEDGDRGTSDFNIDNSDVNSDGDTSTTEELLRKGSRERSSRRGTWQATFNAMREKDAADDRAIEAHMQEQRDSSQKLYRDWQNLVGRRVRTLFDGSTYGLWYTGEVVSVNQFNGQHRIKYSDGERRWHCLEKEIQNGSIKWLNEEEAEAASSVEVAEEWAVVAEELSPPKLAEPQSQLQSPQPIPEPPYEPSHYSSRMRKPSADVPLQSEPQDHSLNAEHGEHIWIWSSLDGQHFPATVELITGERMLASLAKTLLTDHSCSQRWATTTFPLPSAGWSTTSLVVHNSPSPLTVNRTRLYFTPRACLHRHRTLQLV